MRADTDNLGEYPALRTAASLDCVPQLNSLHPRPPCLSVKERLIGVQTASVLRGWLMAWASEETPRSIEIREWVAQDSRSTPHLVVFRIDWSDHCIAFAIAKAAERILEVDLVTHMQLAGFEPPVHPEANSRANI